MNDLRTFGSEAPPKNNRPKIIAAIILLFALGAAGAYSYTSGMWDTPRPSVVPDNRLPGN